MTITIYQSIFNDTARVATGIITPIQVGCALTGDHYGILRDDSGDNISHLNRMYGELTGHYWAWRNDRRSTHIGICHYRRLFIFAGGLDAHINHEGDRIKISSLPPDAEAIFGWQDSAIEAATRSHDIVVPLPYLVTIESEQPRNCAEHFARHHGEENYRTLLRLIDLHSPEHTPYAERFFAGDTMHVANMFVMRRDLFDAYSAWLFRMLEAVTATVDCTRLDHYQVRMPAFMAERLFNIYLMRLRDTEPALKIAELPYVFLENTHAPPKPLEPVRDKQRVVTIVTGFDDNYVTCFGACLASLTEAADPETYYDIVILAEGVSQPYRDLLALQIKDQANIGIRYIDMSGEFNRPEAVHGHFRKATFFRLQLTELLPLHDKVIYVDPDTIILDDIGKLHDIDISEYYAGAVLDPTLQLQLATGFRISPVFGSQTRQEYWDNQLQLSPRAQQCYFNAGLLIFNLRKIRKENCSQTFKELFWTKRFDLVDQDILNKVFDGAIVSLDQRWNVIPQPLGEMARLPAGLYDACMKARQNPAILHFAGPALKPWSTQKVDFFEYFWYFARKSVFYETVYETFIKSRIVAQLKDGLAQAEKHLLSRMGEIEKQLTAHLEAMEEAVADGFVPQETSASRRSLLSFLRKR